MNKKIVPFLVMMLMIATTSLPVLAGPAQYGNSGQYENTTSVNSNVNLDVCITTDWVNGWQDHGLRIREYDIGENVWIYIEFSSDESMYGIHMVHDWYYDTGAGMEYKFSWWWDVDGNYTSAYMWAWEPMSDYYGPGEGYMEVYADGEYIGESNYYAIGNTKPNKPTITGETEGKKGEEIEYKFQATDPDGFPISYLVDWGDDTTSDWTEYVASGTEVTLNHTWDAKDDYQIRCKVRDRAHNESDWETLDITIPKNKAADFNFNLLEWLFYRFPNTFPVLRHLF